MPADRLFLMISTLAFLGAFAVGVYRLLVATYRHTPWTRALMAVGFLGQCAVLLLRGREIGRCPITSPWELLVFLSWGVVLMYWVTGPAYRLSLLGLFTAPMVWVLQVVALTLQGTVAPGGDDAIFTGARPDPMLEWHATVSMLAYAAFGLAATAGVMYLVQERQLKRHEIGPIFRNLPPLRNLSAGLVRLLTVGCALLTAGVLTAYFLEKSPGVMKLTAAWAVWAAYVAVLAYQKLRGWPHRRLALVSAWLFLLPLVTLWVVSGR